MKKQILGNGNQPAILTARGNAAGGMIEISSKNTILNNAIVDVGSDIGQGGRVVVGSD
jgi:hypothetical protein